MAINLSKEDAADIIDRFVENKKMGEWEWDDFLSFRYHDELVQQVAYECNEISTPYPPGAQEGFCNAAGLNRMRELRDLLRSAS